MSDCFDQWRTPSNYLPSIQFSQAFDEAWETLHRRFFKFEAQDYYDEGNDGPFSAFTRNDLETVISRIGELRREDAPFARQARSRGTELLRIHAVEQPLNDYLKYEWLSYIASEALGERIFAINTTVANAVAG